MGFYSSLDPRFTLKHKAADQIVNNSVVLVNDLHLVFSADKNRDYGFILLMDLLSAGAADFRLDFDVPAGSDGHYVGLSGGARLSESVGTPLTFSTTAARQAVVLNGVINIGATSGDVTFQWAQQVADVSDTTLYKGSWLQIQRL